jgi:hypothetical protein
MIIQELREYVFCLFHGKESGPNVVDEKTLRFLGTAFFVTSKGDAVTANHVIPIIDSSKNEGIYGFMLKDKDLKIYKLVAAARFEASDFALLRFDIEKTNYFEIDFSQPSVGTDVMAFGYSDHDIYGGGKELRLLKGHMTMPIHGGIGELSFPITTGMSGGPVLEGTKCLGFMMGNLTSEKLLERSEEISETTNHIEKITLVESKQVLHYGIYRPFSIYEGHSSEIFDKKTLRELIFSRNNS